MATLRDLGLSEYESRAYRALLDTGPTTAKELSRVSDVPMGRIYDVLNSLEGNDLVRSQTAGRPKRYAPVEPEAALDRLLAERKRELDEQKTQYEEIVGDLVESLDSGETPEEPFWTAALGTEEAADLLVERLETADERVIVVAAAPTAQFDLDELGERIAAALSSALDRGVSVSILVHPELVDRLSETVGQRYRRHLQTHDDFAVRTSPNVSGTFELIDRIEVCIEVPHPLDAERTFAVIDVKDSDFATSIQEAFHERWTSASDLPL
jgi:sugar-specific transcriptional regulator TrmB